MGAWNDLTAEASAMRAGNEDVLPDEEYSDDDLIALYKTQAKAEMLLDLSAVLGTSETDALDDVAGENEAVLQAALAHRQLAIFYRLHDTGEGTANRRRLDFYERSYRSDAAGFGRLKKSTGAVVFSTMIRR